MKKTMTTSRQMAERMMQAEGYKERAYQCPAGVWTIGYGHTPADEGWQITKIQAVELFKDDITAVEQQVNANIKQELTQNQFDALVSFTFNLGVGNLKKSTLLKKINANPSDPTIPAEFTRWNKAAGKVLPGLTKRRAMEAEHYTTQGVEPKREYYPYGGSGMSNE